MSNLHPDAFLFCERVTKIRNGRSVVQDVSLRLVKGERLAIVGVSGAGKTTLLRLLAGMESATGSILLDGKPVPDYARGDNPVGMVFQHPIVYPHLSVRENLSLPLQTRNQSKPQIDARIRHLADVLHLNELMDRRASLLSRGEMQRVAIGRALAYPPKLLLLDEPFANLHQTLRWRMVDYLRQLHREHSLTTILVTHEPGDAMYFADRIAVMSQGRILQIGTVSDVTTVPTSLEIAQLLLDPPPNILTIKNPERPGEVIAAWRPADTRLNPPANSAHSETLQLTGVVCDCGHYFDQTLVSVDLRGTIVRALIPQNHHPGVGEKLALTVEKSKLHLFEKHTGQRLN